MAKANSIISVKIDVVAQTLTITTKGIENPIVLAMKDVSPENATYAMLHGFKQRVVDAAAISRDESNGQPATPQEKYDAMKRMADHYASGSKEWSIRESGGSTVDTGLTIRALAAVKGWTESVAREKVDTACVAAKMSSREYLAKIARSTDVARKIAEMRAASSPDSDAMLAELA